MDVVWLGMAQSFIEQVEATHPAAATNKKAHSNKYLLLLWNIYYTMKFHSFHSIGGTWNNKKYKSTNEHRLPETWAQRSERVECVLGVCWHQTLSKCTRTVSPSQAVQSQQLTWLHPPVLQTIQTLTGTLSAMNRGISWTTKFTTRWLRMRWWHRWSKGPVKSPGNFTIVCN